MDAKLIVIGGKANKSEVKLKLPTTIGRSRKADLTVAHPKVSRQHCQIFERDGVLVVRDFGSLNGTFIDNTRVTEAILKPGDKLTVGPLTFVAVYDHDGPLPAASPDLHELPTPAIQAIDLPPPTAQVGRGPGETVAAAPLQPAPADPLETEPPEPPQPPTVRADAPEPAADDFSWLAGETAAAPEAPPAEEPPSPAYEETVSLKGPAADADVTDDLPGPDALADPPEGDSQDFSWLDNAKDQPLDFSAFEGESQAAAPAGAVSASADSGRTTIQEPGVTVAMPKTSEPAPPAPAAPPAAEESFAWLEKLEASPAAPQPAAPPASPSEEGLPHFAEPSAAEEEAGFPPIVAEQPAFTPSPAASGEKKAAAKDAGKKGWWPFGGKPKESGKPKPAAPAVPESLAPLEAAEPAEEPAAPAAPEFFIPGAEEAAEAEPSQPDESEAAKDAKEDDALGEFFKSLK